MCCLSVTHQLLLIVIYKATKNILLVLADWVNKNISPDQKLYVDTDFSSGFNPVSDIIEPIYRPDIVLSDPSAVVIWELTICHETNLAKSKLYKLNKYKDIANAVKTTVASKRVKLFSVEVSVLGVGDTSDFTDAAKLPRMPKDLIKHLANIALSSSYKIYRNRDSHEVICVE